jgi:hypothetical protein
MSDWKQHDGSNCPVDCRDIVDIKLRDNDYYYDCTAEDWQWKSDGTGYRGDILFWRLSEKVANIFVEELSEATLQIVDKIDNVNNPSHYTSHPSGIECIDVTRHMSFNLGNATKYIWRCDLKKDAIEDLQKAIFYLNDEIELRLRLKEKA